MLKTLTCYFFAEPSNNNAWSNQGQDSYHFDSNHQGKDPDYNGFDTGSHDGSSYQEWKSGHGGQYDLTPERMVTPIEENNSTASNV